jgi:GT2 family glycosyltransferase
VDNADQAIDFIKNFNDSDIKIQERRQFAIKNDWLARAKIIETNLKDNHKYSFVILNFNNALRTAVAVDSIVERYSIEHEIIIVDNNSSDDDKKLLKMIKKDFEFIKLIYNVENLGFSGGMNVGITEASGDYIILCNNDICFIMDALNPMRRVLEKNPRIAAVGPMSNNVGNEAFVRVINPLESRNLERIENYCLSMRNKIEKVSKLGFFCVMIPKEIFVQVGKLDEKYGIGYFEDDDFCARLISFGYELAICKDSFVFHSGSATFDKEEIEIKNKQFQKNKQIYESKWGRWTPHRHSKIQPEI